jgi:predicted nucleic acid-binding protein
MEPNRLVISDSGPIFSLAVVDQLEILNDIFSKVFIPTAVWEEVTVEKDSQFYRVILDFFQDKVKAISGFNELTFIMDYGESEAVILYNELEADYLLIDDKKARSIAENFGMQCIGTIGVLSAAKDKKIIKELKPIFEHLLDNKRYFSIALLNSVLTHHGEEEIVR